MMYNFFNCIAESIAQCVLLQHGYGLLSTFFISNTTPRSFVTFAISYSSDMALNRFPSFALSMLTGPVIPALASIAASIPLEAALAGCKILELALSSRNAHNPNDWVPAIPKACVVSLTFNFKSFAAAAAAPKVPAVEVTCHPLLRWLDTPKPIPILDITS
ncbi:hypothetical protein DSECCO2_480490 [anaerobic digester metagenome]